MINPRKIFKGIFNSEKQKNSMKKAIKNIPKPETNIKVGKSIELTNRTIYPIIETSVIGNKKENFVAAEIFPMALVVEETSGNYVISLNGDQIRPEELKKMICPQNGEKSLIEIVKGFSK